MSERTINRWLARIDKDTTEERNAAVQNLHLQCNTQDEIAEAIGMPQPTVNALLSEIANWQIPIIPGMFAEDEPEDSAPEKARRQFEEARAKKIKKYNSENAEHIANFVTPVYNIWKQQTKSEDSGHFGNSESTWVDRLLYLYTQPFDIVLDPFAGGGSTLDVCRKRFRRCWLSDRKPIDERLKEIRLFDVVSDGLPDLRKRWDEVRLVYLDPPYWRQAKGQYSDDASDLANMSLENFTNTLADLVKRLADKMNAGHIALLIQPTQWNAPDRQFTDHVADMLRAVKLPIDMRYSCPYESQQCNAQMVDWAKANRKCLVLSRELVVWRV